jgi:chemotaxis protein CheD
MSEIVVPGTHVGIGQVVTGEAPIVLTTVLGSCVAVTLYDAALKRGGMAHVLARGEGALKGDCRYSDPAIRKLIADVRSKSSEKSGLVAKVAGGSNTTFIEKSSIISSIGKYTMLSILTILVEEGIDIEGMHVGGVGSRNIAFNLETGVVTISTKDRQVVI